MSKLSVRPSVPVSKNCIKLSLCDVYSPKLWVTQTHFWPLADAQAFEAALHDLEHGLSRTLAEFPAFTGRIGRTSDDPRDLVVIVDDDASVDLLYEDLSANQEIPTYDAIKAAGFTFTGLIVPFSSPTALKPVSEGSPLLVVKANRLKGGLALTFGFNHLLADASAIATFERVWAAHTADVSTGTLQHSYKTSGDDEISRHRLSSPALGESATFDDPDWAIFPTAQSQLGLPRVSGSASEEALILQNAKEDLWKTLDADVDSPKWCMWYFSPQSLVQLKKDCSTALAAGEWVSTIDAIVGLFWSRITYLKRSSRGDEKLGKLKFPIDLRSRFEPPLHPGYIGNAVDIVGCEVPLDDLEEPGPTGWATAALAVRRTVTGWKQDRWGSWLAVVKHLPPDQALCPNPLMLLDHRNMAFNDYSRSDSNVLDWGRNLGRIDRTRYMKPAGSMKGCATAVVVHPRLADGGLEIATTTTDDLQQLLLGDEVFKRYAKLTCAFT